MNPRAAINDLLPFQGSPFGQLGYFSKLPYTIVFSFRFTGSVLYYIVSFLVCQELFNFFRKFLFSTSGESGIRTHAPLRTNGFQDRLVMTTSISLHIYFFVFCASLSAQDIFYHRMFLLSTPNFTFFYIFSKKFLQCRDLPVL